MSALRLLHCSDLHLDAGVGTHLDPKRAKLRREELLLTFGSIVEKAKELQARVVMIAGDLFDTQRATLRARQYVGQMIADQAEIRFVYVSGNHDRDVLPLFPDGIVPRNWIDLSGEEWSSVTLCEGERTVTISGTTGLEHEEIYQNVPLASGFHIVMLHGEVASSAAAERDKIVLSGLSDRGIDYLALGHYHSYRTDALGRRGVWCYSGCPEGRGFDECGEKGVVLLELTPNDRLAAGFELRQTFLPLARRTIHKVQVDISDCENDRAVTARTLAALEAIPESDMVSVELTGELPVEISPDTLALERLLCERFFTAKVESATTLRLCVEDYLHDISLKGEFIRTVMAAGLPPEQRDRVIICGLRALRGEEAEL